MYNLQIQEGCLSKQFISIANDGDIHKRLVLGSPQKYIHKHPSEFSINLYYYMRRCCRRRRRHTPYPTYMRVQLGSNWQIHTHYPKTVDVRIWAKIYSARPWCTNTTRAGGTMPSECSHKRTRQIYTHSRGRHSERGF